MMEKKKISSVRAGIRLSRPFFLERQQKESGPGEDTGLCEPENCSFWNEPFSALDSYLKGKELQFE